LGAERPLSNVALGEKKGDAGGCSLKALRNLMNTPNNFPMPQQNSHGIRRDFFMFSYQPNSGFQIAIAPG